MTQLISFIASSGGRFAKRPYAPRLRFMSASPRLIPAIPAYAGIEFIPAQAGTTPSSSPNAHNLTINSISLRRYVALATFSQRCGSSASRRSRSAMRLAA